MKKKTTTQRILVEDYLEIKNYQEKEGIKYFYEALHEYIRSLKAAIDILDEQLEEKEKLLELKNQKLYEVLETNKGMQRRIKELEQKVKILDEALKGSVEREKELHNKCIEYKMKLQEYEEHIKKLEKQLDIYNRTTAILIDKAIQKIKRFLGL